jgi:hypothetical protein
MTRRVVVDETKRRGYVLVASAHLSGDVESLRKVVRGLTLKGQTRIHMKKENDSRRRLIVSELLAAGVTADVYQASRKDEFDARYACLDRLLGQLAGGEDTILTLEQDDSLIIWDRRRLFDLTRMHGLEEPKFRYEHGRAAAEPLLSIPDAIAWCWTKGGDWRRRVEPMILGTYRV